MNKEAIYKFIASKNIWYQVIEHQAVFKMEDLSKAEIDYPDSRAKNLFVRDDKKRNYYLITVKGDKRVDLKKISTDNEIRRLSFASEQDLLNIIGLSPGSVTPFGLLNDDELKVKFYIDKDFMEKDSIVGIHPNDNTATVILYVKDLINIIQEHGNEVDSVEI